MGKNPDPIQQRIEIDADTSGAHEAAKATDDYQKQVEESSQATDKAARSEKQHDAALDNSTRSKRRATRATDEQSDAMSLSDSIANNAADTFKAMAASMAGAFGVVAVFQAWKQEIETTNQALLKNEEIVRRNAEARLDLAALNGFEDPKQLLELDRLAITSGTSPAEAARLATFTNSVFPNPQFSGDQRSSFLNEVARIKQTSSASLTEIAGALYPLVLEGADSRQAGNIYQTGVKQAGEPEPAAYAAAAAEFVGFGKEIGRLDLGQSYGYAAGALSLGLPSPERAVTGLKALLVGIRAPQNDASKELLARYGITSDTGINEALERLSVAREAGELSDADIISLAGREGLAVASKLLRPDQLKAFQSRVRIVDQAEDYKGSIAAEQSGNINRPGSIQGYNLLAKQGEAEAEANLASDKKAAERAAAREQLDAILADKLKSGELDEADVEVIREEFSYQLAQGATIQQAINRAETVQSGLRVPIPIPDLKTGKVILSDVNVNPIKQGIGDQRGLDNFLEDELLERLKSDPSAAPDPDNQQGAATGQGLDIGAVVASMDRLNETMLRQQALMEQMPQQAARTINFNGPYNAGDPMVDDLDGRDRWT